MIESDYSSGSSIQMPQCNGLRAQGKRGRKSPTLRRRPVVTIGG